MDKIDPYDLCPCGTGKKFKWCCLAGEPFIERAQRQLAQDKPRAALKALDEGAKAHPKNAWLQIERSGVLLRSGQHAEAAQALEEALRVMPEAFTALVLQVRILAETQGAHTAAARMQGMLEADWNQKTDDESTTIRQRYASLMVDVGESLVRSQEIVAGLAHLRWAVAHGVPETAARATEAIDSVMASARISPWLKREYSLEQGPTRGSDPRLEKFRSALTMARDGLWTRAATDFSDVAEQDLSLQPMALWNAGLCLLWSGQSQTAVESLRRTIARKSPDDEAVIDLEVLCQLQGSFEQSDLIDLVHLSWPIQHRAALLTTLQRHDRFQELRTSESNERDPSAPRLFTIVEPVVSASALSVHTALEDVPQDVAALVVTDERCVLEAVDDSRLESWCAAITQVAGESLSSDPPSREIVGARSRFLLALENRLVLPAGVGPEVVAALELRFRKKQVRTYWPETPSPHLGGLSPRAAAEKADHRVALRAAYRLFRHTHFGFDDLLPALDALRDQLKLPIEPPITLTAQTDLSTIPVTQLDRIRLDPPPINAKLGELFLHSARSGHITLALRTARLLADRPEVFTEGHAAPYPVFGLLAQEALREAKPQEALAWVERGRQSGSGQTSESVPERWDMLELRIRAQSESPTQWVPYLQSLIMRSGSGESRTETTVAPLLTQTLIQLGLIQVTTAPEDPQRRLLDTRPLQALLSRFGTPESGGDGLIDVQAGGGTDPASSIWTPGRAAAAQSGGAIWTPGRDAGPTTTPETKTDNSADPGRPSKIIMP